MHEDSCLAKDLDAAVCSGTTAAGGPSEGSLVATSGLPGSAFLQAGTHEMMTAAEMPHKIECPTSLVTGLATGRSGVQFPAGMRFSHPNRSAWLWGPPSLLFNGPWGRSDRGMNLTAHFHPVPRLRVGGAVPLLPLYVFMEWKRTTVSLLRH